MQYERFEGSWFLKSNWHLVKTGQSDQSKGVPVPPQEEPPAPEDCVINLPPPDSILRAFEESREQKRAAGSFADTRTSEKPFWGVPERAAVLYHLFVKNENLQLREVDLSGFHMINQTTGRRDQNGRIAREQLHLFRIRHAAKNRDGFQMAECSRIFVSSGGDLQGKFAGWC